MKIVSILNHKGGVGKTTFTGCTAQALALIGQRVLAIDNDSQHNLSSLLGVGLQTPSIRDIYRAGATEAPSMVLKSIRRTPVENLHIITASGELRDGDVGDIRGLGNALNACGLARFYDHVLIDNAPGVDRLQEASLVASHEIFVPTELRQFAVDGLVEMERTLARLHPGSARITKIIPNFYRDTRRQKTFISALMKLFPGRVMRTCIPVDSVFDEVVTEGKILFLHRLYSKGAAFYLKLIHELYDLDEGSIWESVVEKRKECISNEARRRFFSKSPSLSGAPLEQQAQGEHE